MRGNVGWAEAAAAGLGAARPSHWVSTGPAALFFPGAPRVYRRRGAYPRTPNPNPAPRPVPVPAAAAFKPPSIGRAFILALRGRPCSRRAPLCRCSGAQCTPTLHPAQHHPADFPALFLACMHQKSSAPPHPCAGLSAWPEIPRSGQDAGDPSQCRSPGSLFESPNSFHHPPGPSARFRGRQASPAEAEGLAGFLVPSHGLPLPSASLLHQFLAVHRAW